MEKRPSTSCNRQSRPGVRLEKVFGTCGAEGDANDGGAPYGTETADLRVGKTGRVGDTRGKRLCCKPLTWQALPLVSPWVPRSLMLNEPGSGCVTSVPAGVERSPGLLAGDLLPLAE